MFLECSCAKLQICGISQETQCKTALQGRLLCVHGDTFREGKSPTQVCLTLPTAISKERFSICDRNKGLSRRRANSAKSYGHVCVLGSPRSLIWIITSLKGGCYWTNTSEAKGVRHSAQGPRGKTRTVPGPLHLNMYTRGHLLTQAKT